MPGHGPPEFPPQKAPLVRVEQPCHADCVLVINSPVVLISWALEYEKQVTKKSAEHSLLIKWVTLVLLVCRDLVWIGLPCYLGLRTDLSLVGARCSCVPHGIKHTPVLAQSGHCRHFHAHVIECFGVFQSFAVLVSHSAARTHTHDLCLYCTRCARGA